MDCAAGSHASGAATLRLFPVRELDRRVSERGAPDFFVSIPWWHQCPTTFSVRRLNFDKLKLVGHQSARLPSVQFSCGVNPSDISFGAIECDEPAPLSPPNLSLADLS